MSSIRTFKTFLAVAKHGSFTAAGKDIGLTAAAVGLQVRSLEEKLNRVLFDRGPRTVVLNTEGRQLVGKIEDLVLRYESLAAGADGDELSGTVVMGALISALMGAFADALWSLKQENPRLKIQLFAGLSSDFVRQVEQGELDAAVVTQPPHPLPASVLWTPLYAEPMVLVVPRRPHFRLHDRPLDILRYAPFIRFDRHTWTGDLVKDVLRQCKVTAVDEMELNSVEAIIEIVRQGFGVSIVPKLANIEWASDQALEVVKLPGVEVQRCVGLVERTRHGRMRFTGEIKDYFRSTVGNRRTGRPREAKPVHRKPKRY